MSLVVVSNGFNRFHLSVAAAEAARRDLLAGFLTGAYPTASSRTTLVHLGLARHPRFERLLDRAEPIPETLVRAQFFSEWIYRLGFLPLPGASELDRLSWRLYAKRAAPHVERVGSGARVFHYRAGFGHASARAARRHAMTLLCDHSIAHPSVLHALVSDHGRLPEPGVPRRRTRLWDGVLRDIEQADAVLVNSSFVRETFLHEGWEPDRVHTIYLGVDDSFLKNVPPRSETTSGPLRLMFAGSLEPRKGSNELADALLQVDDIDWRLRLAGSVAKSPSPRVRALLRDPRVETLGTLSRRELAAEMSGTDVFVFPSLAEGSARVVFEALACGCYIVTTPNAGSIVEDGAQGTLVPPGDPGRLAAALRSVAALDREELGAIGARNARLVRDRYTQRDYGAALAELWLSLAGAEARRAA